MVRKLSKVLLKSLTAQQQKNILLKDVINEIATCFVSAGVMAQNMAVHAGDVSGRLSSGFARKNG